jgi:hypothetical protein
MCRMCRVRHSMEAVLPPMAARTGNFPLERRVAALTQHLGAIVLFSGVQISTVEP